MTEIEKNNTQHIVLNANKVIGVTEIDNENENTYLNSNQLAFLIKLNLTIDIVVCVCSCFILNGKRKVATRNKTLSLCQRVLPVCVHHHAI
jgi:hypothetical protein